MDIGLMEAYRVEAGPVHKSIVGGFCRHLLLCLFFILLGHRHYSSFYTSGSRLLTVCLHTYGLARGFFVVSSCLVRNTP